MTEMYCKFARDAVVDNTEGDVEYDGCLNVAIQMVRQSSKDLSVPVKVEMNEYRDTISKLKEDQYLDNSYCRSCNRSNSHRSTGSSTHMCAVFTCSAWKARDDTSTYGFTHHEINKDNATDRSLICNSADRLQMIVSVASYQDHLTEANEDMSQRRMHEISTQVKDTCWQHLQGAIDLGIHELRQRHLVDFRAKMSTIQLSLPQSQPKSMPPSPYNFQRPTIPQLYQHARYLLLSSSRHSVPNLQGIWADGPHSAWAEISI